MTLKKTLTAILNAVVDEAARNPDFRERIEGALGTSEKAQRATKQGSAHAPDEERKGGRRAAAILDPIDLARQGEPVLRERLMGLELDRLLDIVAEYGMDPGKLVMKWKDRERVADRIVDISMGRATKGDAFRKD